MSTSPNTLNLNSIDKMVARVVEAFPSDPIKPSDLPADIYYKAGQASVVLYILQLLEEDDVR
jgi:hypothetical protein